MWSFAVCAILLPIVFGTPITVTTPNGAITGSIDANEVFASFKGIPYAEPPERWMSPVPKASWAPKTLQATEFGSGCMQDPKSFNHNPGLTASEDCLFVNVWTPFQAAIDPPASSLPVMVYIHGGGFVSGTGADADFWGNHIVNRSSIGLVTVNYRLGVWGFLSGNSQYAPRGNFGLQDQQMALSWVQSNIASFGGNPKLVTIFGQSAGGMSIELHLVVPSSFGLYAHAIAQSNPASMHYRTPEDNEKYFQAFARDMLCNASASSVMSCLRSRSNDWILKVQTLPEYVQTLRLPIRTGEGLVWEPVIDGVLLPDQPLTLITTGKHNTNAKVIFGTDRNETNGFLSMVPSLNALEYEILVAGIFSTNASTILKQYPAMGAASLEQANILLTDYLFVCPVRYISKFFQQYATSPESVFLYNFLYSPKFDPDNQSPGCVNAACHGVELEFVFDSRTQIPGNYSFTPQEQVLSNVVSGLWTSFASYGIPVYSSASQPLQNVTWPAFQYAQQQSLALDVPLVTVVSNYNANNCDFWDRNGYIY